MNIIESLQRIGNHEAALKVSSYLLKTYDTALAGCENNDERKVLKVAFSELLQSEI